MDAYEATRIVFSRIQALDPENASKIMGILLIQNLGEKEMIRLALGPDTLLHSIFLKAKKDLGVAASPSTSFAPVTASPFLPSRQQNSSFTASSSAAVSRLQGFGLSMPLQNTWASTAGGYNPADELISHSPSYPMNGLNFGRPASPTAASYLYGAGDLIEDFQLQDQLSFLNDAAAAAGSPNSIHSLNADATGCNDGGMLFPYGSWAGAEANGHRRSSSVADICLGSDPAGLGLGWKPCLYYARGYCKNGSSCRFFHGLADPVGAPDATAAAAAMVKGGKLDMLEQCQELLRSKSQRLGSISQLTAPLTYPYSGSGPARSRMERGEITALGGGMVNPGSRQIYLTFPADSTFREEDVSKYFSTYGPVQDVRIPYQQKRMFGFVTFVYPETVKLILAKGNPHFVCDARVLVKPYKEKGKVPDKYRKQHSAERGDFSFTTPSSIDCRDACDQQLGARMYYNPNEQSDLQQVIEMQERRLMSLQLLDVKRNSSSPLQSPSPDQFNPSIFDRSSPEEPTSEDNSSSPAADKLVPLSSDPFVQAGKESTGIVTAEGSPEEDGNFYESSGLDHNLPDSPFASPTKGEALSLLSSSTVPSNNNLKMSYKSCFFQMPSLSSDHGAVGM